MVTLIQRTIDFDGLFRGRNTFERTTIREGAIGDGEIGEQPGLISEMADTYRQIEAAPADVDRVGGIDDGVEDAEIGIGATGRALQIGLPRDPQAFLDFAHGLAAA